MNTDSNQIFISVIVPIFGVEKHIERCLTSLFEQTMINNVEFIFVNDATQDNSIFLLKEVLKSYKNRENQVKLIEHKENRGLAAARNTGLDHALGEYVMHVDSDDFFENDMLEIMYKYAKETDADMVVADYFLSFANKEKYIKCEIPTSKKILIENMIIGSSNNSIGSMNWNKIIRRSLYRNNNIHYINGVNYNEDLVVMVPLSYCALKIVKVDRAFVHYVQFNGDSYTKKLSLSNVYNRFEATRFIEDYLKNCEDNYSNSIKIKRFIDKFYAILSSYGPQQKKFLLIDPELSKDKCLYKYINIRWRLPYKLALNGYPLFFNLYRRFKEMAKAILKRILSKLNYN